MYKNFLIFNMFNYDLFNHYLKIEGGKLKENVLYRKESN
jgi:hypothetical protein